MLDLFIVIACLAVNALFSAYEMAFVTISREELDELEENKSLYRRIASFKKKPERTLSVIQIGITLVGAIAAAVGGTGAVESLEPYFVETFGFSRSLAEGVSVIVVIVPLTYFSVVFGELVPKTIALKHPVKVIAFGTRLLSFIDQLLSPIVSFLEISTNYLLKIIGMDAKEEEDESVGESVEIGNLAEYHQQFVHNLIDLKGLRVSKVMVPLDKVTYFNFSDSEELVRSKLIESPHSRFPVIDGDVVVGTLLKKELPDSQLQQQIPWQSVLRPSIKIPASSKVLEALLKLQAAQTPLGVVENEEHRPAGIITLEDIIEQVVGDIKDRTDNSRTSKLLSHRPKITLKSKP